VTFFGFIEAEYASQAHPAAQSKAVAFRNLPVSRSGYYAWRKRASGQQLSVTAQRRADLHGKILSVHREERGTYGSPRMTAELRARGEVVSEKTIAAIMAAHGITGISPRSFRPPTTVIDAAAFTPPDLIGRRFDQGRLDAVWYSDITYLRCGQGDVFLCAIRDGHSRKVLGWQVADHMRADLVVQALQMAIDTRAGTANGVIFHADRGCQYTSGQVADVCAENGIKQSVGRTGVCWDNAAAESFWSIFKHEYYYRHTFTTKAELYAAVDAWMIRYNSHRRNSTIGQLSPNDYEAGLATDDLAA
jgi:putative transposase